jgi:hypothetical protein
MLIRKSGRLSSRAWIAMTRSRKRQANRSGADLQLARQIIGIGGFRGLFEALARGVALPAAAFAPLGSLLQQEENRQGG